MTPEEQQLLGQHAVGFAGVLANALMCLSPLKAVREARRTGNLGGLDTRSWPAFYTCNLLWTCYSYRIGDVWLFFSAGPPAVMWLFFNLTAIKLLAKEEGEFDSSGKAWEGGLTFRCKTANREDLCKEYRSRCIQDSEHSMVAGFCIACLVSFFCGPWEIAGLEFLEYVITRDLRINIFLSLCCLSSIICMGKPITRLYVLCRRRDASTIFLPLVFATMLSNSLWAYYGIFTLNPYLVTPNTIGLFASFAQILLRLIFWQERASEALDQDEDEVAMDSVMPKALMDKSKLAIPHSMSTVDADDVSLPSDIESNLASPDLSRRKSELSDLPDLTNRLKEQGVYEDYLKWQHGYRKWRQGSARGSHGELVEAVNSTRLGATLRVIPDMDSAMPGEIPSSEDAFVESA